MPETKLSPSVMEIAKDRKHFMNCGLKTRALIQLAEWLEKLMEIERRRWSSLHREKSAWEEAVVLPEASTWSMCLPGHAVFRNQDSKGKMLEGRAGLTSWQAGRQAGRQGDRLHYQRKRSLEVLDPSDSTTVEIACELPSQGFPLPG